MDTELMKIQRHIETYFQQHLEKYAVLKIRKKSYHPDDSHLYMVSAGKSDGTYAVWTCWNESTQSLSYGHYGLQDEQDCEKIFKEYYYGKPSGQNKQKG